MDGDKTFYIGRRKVIKHEPCNDRTVWEWTVGKYWVAYETEVPGTAHNEHQERTLLIAEPNKEDKQSEGEQGDRGFSAAWNAERLRFKYVGADLDDLKAMSLLIKFLDSQKKTKKAEGAKDD